MVTVRLTLNSAVTNSWSAWMSMSRFVMQLTISNERNKCTNHEQLLTVSQANSWDVLLRWIYDEDRDVAVRLCCWARWLMCCGRLNTQGTLDTDRHPQSTSTQVGVDQHETQACCWCSISFCNWTTCVYQKILGLWNWLVHHNAQGWTNQLMMHSIALLLFFFLPWWRWLQ